MRGTRRLLGQLSLTPCAGLCGTENGALQQQLRRRRGEPPPRAAPQTWPSPGKGRIAPHFLHQLQPALPRAWQGSGGVPDSLRPLLLARGAPFIRVSPTVEFPERAKVEPEISGERGSPQALCYPIESGLRTFGCTPEDSLPVS